MGQFKKKNIIDYNGERETKAMMDFAVARMPNFVEKVDGDKGLQKFLTKAEEYGLPQVLVFSKSSTTSSMIKAISTEFRRKALVGEVKATKNNQAILKKYNVKDLPKVVMVNSNGDVVQFDKKPSYNSLHFFVGKHALKKPVFGKKAAEDKKAKKEL